jgi:hypothetical protein
MAEQPSYILLECHTVFGSMAQHFTAGETYPIQATYHRGPQMIEGQLFYFAQTTFKIANDDGNVVYIPFACSTFFVKKKARVELQSVEEVMAE